jgi:transcription antitermination factor NusG
MSSSTPGHGENGSWCLAQYKPRNLERAELTLRRQGFSTFCPKQQITSPDSGVTGQTKPLFPNYIFVRSVRGSADWRTINNTFGIVRLVGRTPTRPSLVTEQIIAEIQARCDENAVLIPAKAKVTTQLSPEPFSDFMDEVLELPDERRGFALMNYLQI